jgi:hypothetical protein
MAVKVLREEMIATNRRPVVALVDQSAELRVAAVYTGRAGLSSADFIVRKGRWVILQSGENDGAVAWMKGSWSLFGWFQKWPLMLSSRPLWSPSP